MKRKIMLTLIALMAFTAPVYAEETSDVYYGEEDYADDTYYDEYYADPAEDYGTAEYPDGEYAGDPYYAEDPAAPAPEMEMNGDYAQLMEAYLNLENRVKALEEKYDALAGSKTAASAPAAEPQKKEVITQDLEWIDGIPGVILTGEYAFPEFKTNCMQYVLTFKNESEEDVSFVCRAAAKDAEGNVIAESTEEVVRVGTGFVVPVVLSFPDLDYYDVIGINYQVASYETDTNKPAQDLITCETDQTGNSLNITMTAKEKAIDDAMAVICTFKEDKMVLQDCLVFDLEPDTPQTQTYDLPEGLEYDRYSVYVTGYYQE